MFSNIKPLDKIRNQYIVLLDHMEIWWQ